MLLLKLSTGGSKPAAFILGGEQGRDWMSTAIILNFISNLLENPQDDLLKHFNFYFVPVFNPDGYEHIRNGECYSVYLGQKCLSEEETKTLASFLNSIAVNLLAFINLRGFANLVTVPYAKSDLNANNKALLTWYEA
ncbi:Carboxypeptidase A4 [Operophtera brumata]|uniref:Carboxypeptidase A4 n=1 Tax=Operophtera brumata TaxID=104452 RepID=A0A0L7L6W2_OPEBR|nr:Carboxypeptidase A4 [Operophtera brumata]